MNAIVLIEAGPARTDYRPRVPDLSLDLRPERFAKLCPCPKVVAKVIDEWVPYRGVDVRLITDNGLVGMDRDSLNLDDGKACAMTRHPEIDQLCLNL